MYWNGWSHMSWMGWMWIWWILFIVVVVLLVRWLVGKAPGSVRPESPEQELKRRYARGEIDRDEFLRRLEDLRR